MWPKFKLIQAFIHFLVTCKNEEDPFKMMVLEWSHHLSHCKSMGIFSDAEGQVTRSAVPSRIWPKLKFFQAFLVVLDTCKNKEDPIKNESTRVVTTLY